MQSDFKMFFCHCNENVNKGVLKWLAYLPGYYNILVSEYRISAHGQCKNSQVTPQASASQLIPLDHSVVTTLDMLDC